MPFKSQAQRALAHAVASGKAKDVNMSKAAAERMIADDPGGKLPAKKCGPCKPGKGKKSISSSLRRAMARKQRENNMDVG